MHGCHIYEVDKNKFQFVDFVRINSKNLFERDKEFCALIKLCRQRTSNVERCWNWIFFQVFVFANDNLFSIFIWETFSSAFNCFFLIVHVEINADIFFLIHLQSYTQNA